MTDLSMPLTAGFVLDRFTIDRVIALNASAILYRVSETVTGSPFMLREYLPFGRVMRDAGGRLTTQDKPAAQALEAGIARFLANGARASALRHPGIANIARWFKANGTAYWVMPWQPGMSLASMIRGGQKLSAQETLKLALPLLDALEYLHAQDVIHQELNPESIHVLEAGGAVLLAPGTPASHQDEAAVASTGEIDGAYAAIEQFKPELKSGPWTDIYSMAAILHRCVSGAAPPTALQRWNAAQSGGPDPLPVIEPAASQSEAQREIATLIARGLVMEPPARPQSVRQWRARISRSVAAADEQQSSRGRRQAAEDRSWRPGMLFGVFLIGIAGIGAYLLFHQSSGVITGDKSISQPAQEVGSASAQETERWRQALEANAVVGYRKFIEDFPQSVHIQQAQEHVGLLEDKAWEQVVEENTKAGYESHLAVFPHGRHATEALARIEEFNQQEARLARAHDARMREDDAAWNKAREAGNLAGVDAYISAWPGGAHIQEARGLRQELQYQSNDTSSFDIAARENTITAYRSYIGDFPDGRHVAAAQEAIDSLTLRPGKVFQDCGDCPQMVVAPAGAFWQGSAEGSPLAVSIEKPRHRVVIADAFAVGIHEITMAQWDVCVAEGACDTRPADNAWGRGNRPVMMVSWNDAVQYAGWISARTGQAYSLPTESQWEYVARAGEESDWLGGDPAAICRYGNIAGDETRFEWRHTDCADGSALATMPVGSYHANAFGLYDVIGNVAEWTLDCMNLSYLEAPADGGAWSRGMCSSRMTRGGSWFTGTRESRLSARFNLKNGDRNDFTGFRLVRRVEKQ